MPLPNGYPPANPLHQLNPMAHSTPAKLSPRSVFKPKNKQPPHLTPNSSCCRHSESVPTITHHHAHHGGVHVLPSNPPPIPHSQSSDYLRPRPLPRRSSFDSPNPLPIPQPGTAPPPGYPPVEPQRGTQSLFQYSLPQPVEPSRPRFASVNHTPAPGAGGINPYAPASTQAYHIPPYAGGPRGAPGPVPTMAVDYNPYLTPAPTTYPNPNPVATGTTPSSSLFPFPLSLSGTLSSRPPRVLPQTLWFPPGKPEHSCLRLYPLCLPSGLFFFIFSVFPLFVPDMLF